MGSIISDLTVIVGLRAHCGNPWIFERLERLANHYAPRPRVLIVDSGSSPGYAQELKSRCDAHGLDYLYDDDGGVFSLSRARNLGALWAQTRLLFFTDIDFFAQSDFFAVLDKQASAAQMESIFDESIAMPAYHLNKSASERLMDPALDRAAFDQELLAIAWKSTAEQFGKGEAEFIAPYSNNFLCAKEWFDYIGGYDEAFRGHGSEDFEFMIRAAMHRRDTAIPEAIEEDIFRPGSPGFFVDRSYRGFRRLAEALSVQGELTGLKMFHFWHPRNKVDPWQSQGDGKRTMLRTRLDQYRTSQRGLLGADSLPRATGIALCISCHPGDAGFFLPLRLLGYRLHWIDGSERHQVESRLKTEAIVAVFVATIMADPAPQIDVCVQAWCQSGPNRRAYRIERGLLPRKAVYRALGQSTLAPIGWQEANGDAEGIAKLKDELRALVKTPPAASLERKARVIVVLDREDALDALPVDAPRVLGKSMLDQLHQVAVAYPDVEFVFKLPSMAVIGPFANVTILQRGQSARVWMAAADLILCIDPSLGLLAAAIGCPSCVIAEHVTIPGLPFATSMGEAMRMWKTTALIQPSQEWLEDVLKKVHGRESGFEILTDNSGIGIEKGEPQYRIRLTRLILDGRSRCFDWRGIMSDKQQPSYVTARLGAPVPQGPVTDDTKELKSPAKPKRWTQVKRMGKAISRIQGRLMRVGIKRLRLAVSPANWQWTGPVIYVITAAGRRCPEDDAVLSAWAQWYSAAAPQRSLCIAGRSKSGVGAILRGRDVLVTDRPHLLRPEFRDSDFWANVQRGFSEGMDPKRGSGLQGKMMPGVNAARTADCELLLHLTGGNDVHPDRKASGYTVGLLAAMRATNKHVRLVATGMGLCPAPAIPDCNRRQILEILAHYDLIECRDFASYQMLRDLGCRGGNLILGCDDLFQIDWKQIEAGPVEDREKTLHCYFADGDLKSLEDRRAIPAIVQMSSEAQKTVFWRSHEPCARILEKLRPVVKGMTIVDIDDPGSMRRQLGKLDTVLTSSPLAHLIAAKHGLDGAYAPRNKGDVFRHDSLCRFGSSFRQGFKSRARLPEKDPVQFELAVAIKEKCLATIRQYLERG